jgi:hypothetical protein
MQCCETCKKLDVIFGKLKCLQLKIEVSEPDKYGQKCPIYEKEKGDEK